MANGDSPPGLQVHNAPAMLRTYLLNKVGQGLGHKTVILNRSAAEVKNLDLDRRFGHCNVRFFASLRSAQNDTGMIIWLPHNIEMIPQNRISPPGWQARQKLVIRPRALISDYEVPRIQNRQAAQNALA